MTIKPSRSRWHRVGVAGIFLLAGLLFCVPLFYGNVPTNGGTQPAFHNLMFDSHEKMHYIIRLSEMDDALRHGQILVRWCRNLEGGFGYPFFNFYAPLSYFGAELWRLVGADLFLSWKLHFFGMTVLAGLGMYALARRFCSRPAAVLAGMLYVFAPYRTLNLYVRGNVAEYAAMSLLPLLALGFQAVLSGGKRGAFALAALTTAALIMTHNLTAFFAGGLIFVWITVARLLSPSAQWQRAIGAGALGLGLSAVFWMPAVLEARFCQTPGLAQTFAETTTHVLYWRQYFSLRWGFGLSEPGPNDALSFSIGLVQWTLLTLGLASVWQHRGTARSMPAARAFVTFAVPFALLLFGMTWMASPVWRIPGFAAIQFPWRLMAFASMLAALLGGLAVDLLGKRKSLIALAASLTAIAFAIPTLRVSAYYPMPPAMYRPEETRARFIATNIGEFLPVWVKSFPSSVSQRRVFLDNRNVARAVTDDSTDFSFTVTSDKAQPLIYEQFYFPGWKATRDGNSIPVRPSAGGGLIVFDAQRGSHTYQIWLGWSPARMAGVLISLSGAGILVVLALRRKRLPVAPPVET